MKRFKDILCVVEFGKSVQPALDRAIALAESNQANLTVVEVVPQATGGIGLPPGGPISDEFQAALVSDRLQKLDDQLEPYRKRSAIQARIIVGTVFLEVIREVQRGKYDLVIKTPEASDWLDRLFDSNDMHLLRKCPCPVWMTKSQAKQKYRSILAAVDLGNQPTDKLAFRDALNLQILELSNALALSEFSELHVVYAWQSIGKKLMTNAFYHPEKEGISAQIDQEILDHAEGLNTLLQSMFDQLGLTTCSYLNPQTHLIEGDACKEIPVLAKKIGADIVVMGTVARTGIPGFIMGNTAETILSQIECSVLAIKPSGFVSPVTLDIN